MTIFPFLLALFRHHIKRKYPRFFVGRVDRGPEQRVLPGRAQGAARRFLYLRGVRGDTGHGRQGIVFTEGLVAVRSAVFQVTVLFFVVSKFFRFVFLLFPSCVRFIRIGVNADEACDNICPLRRRYSISARNLDLLDCYQSRKSG